MTAAASSRPVMSERRVALIGALLVAIGPVSMLLYTPAMPEIVRALGTTDAMVKMTLTVYFAGFAFTQLVCGPLSDGLGRRPVTLGFMGIYLLASIMALFSSSIEMLLAARFLQGVGAAVGVAISRAVVRDLFVSESSARIMNLMGMLLAVAPAIAPAIGGLALEVFEWPALFLLMALLGAATVGVVAFSMRETVVRDPARIRPLALVASYRMLLANPYFMLSSLVIAGSAGALYTLATVLPFILMNVVGLTPSAFGAGLLLQAGAYFLGTLCVRPAMARVGANRLVPVGLAFTAAGSVALLLLLLLVGPTFLTVMGPVAVCCFGVAFVMPAMLTVSLAPFPRMAGAASAMTGFLQMGGGLLGSAVATLFADPVLALASVVPAMGAGAILAWLLWRRLPHPAVPLPAASDLSAAE